MNQEVRKMVMSFVPGVVLVMVLWLVKWLEVTTEHSLSTFGVYPRTFAGLKGVITSPLIHGDWRHLVSNSVPLLVLGAGLFYFYKSIAFRVFAGIYLLSGFWLWLGGRESYHIGASGLVYGLTTFLFFSGVFRRDMRLMALSLLVVFLYGGMVWGIFPLFTGISWEAHLFGAVSGILFAYAYRREGPQRKVYEWEHDGDDEDDPNAYWKLPQPKSTPDGPPNDAPQQVNIRYIYRPNSPGSSSSSPDPHEKN